MSYSFVFQKQKVKKKNAIKLLRCVNRFGGMLFMFMCVCIYGVLG